MLHVGVFGCVEFDVILGQDLHDGPDLQPPLCLRDAVPAADRGGILVTMWSPLNTALIGQ